MRVTSRMEESCVYSERNFINKSKFLNTISFVINVWKTLKKENPQIVQIHACWNFRAAIVQALAKRFGCFTIVSPHCGLDESIIHLDFWKEKLFKLATYQYWMIKKATSIVAISHKEYESLQNLDWSNNISLINNPVVEKIHDDDLASKVMQHHRMIIDSHYTLFITEEEKDFVIKCVVAGVYPDDMKLPKQFNETIETSNLHFRRIYIYAYDNRVTKLMMRGIARLHLNVPPQLNVESLSLFTLKFKISSDYVTCKNLCKTIKKVIPDVEITPQLTNIGEIALITHTELFCALRFNDFDEDKFEKQIHENGVPIYTKSLLKYLQKKFYLEDGFTPISL